MSNKEFLIEAIIQDLVTFLMKEKGLDMQSALRFIYNSDTYEKLMDEETGLYFQSSGYVYDILDTEYKMGKIQ